MKTRPSLMLRYQRGQSMVELLALAFVLVPLVIIVPLLGKYIDMAQTTTVASRYVAFEGTVHHGSSGTVWKTDAQLATEVRRRFYSRNDLGINTNDIAGEFQGDRNPLWVDHRGNALLPAFDRVAVQARRSHFNQPFGSYYANNFGLPQDNLYTGAVGVAVANVPKIGVAFDKSGNSVAAKPFDNLNLQINRTTTVLVDPWAAKGPSDVKGKIEGAGQDVLPTTHLEAFKFLLTIPYAMAETLPGGSATLPELGYVKPDIIPTDRLQPYE